MNNYPILKNFSTTMPLSEADPLLLKEIQEILKEGGFYKDEIVDEYTNNVGLAFKDFKKKAYLEYPSIIGINTAKALLEIAGDATHPIPIEPVEDTSINKGVSIKLPNGEIVYSEKPMFGVKHFTWGEATKNGSRIPTDTFILKEILSLGKYLDVIRDLFNRPITISSWYRPPLINQRVGGVSNSQHLTGSAVDFLVLGIPPQDVYRRLNSWHGDKGGLGNSNYFTHLDLRGYKARWLYGNA